MRTLEPEHVRRRRQRRKPCPCGCGHVGLCEAHKARLAALKAHLEAEDKHNRDKHNRRRRRL